jgi:hypothetical protein
MIPESCQITSDTVDPRFPATRLEISMNLLSECRARRDARVGDTRVAFEPGMCRGRGK